MQIEFRNCKYEDLEFILKLKELGFKWYYEKIGGWDIDYQIKRTTQEINKFIDTMKIIVKDNKDIGVTNFFQDNNEYVVGLILLHPDYQNYGIGTYILKEYIDVAKNEQKPIKLSTYKYNPAKNLYERLGFKQYNEDEIDSYLRIDFNNKKCIKQSR